jgi:hypothetical protein
MTTNQPEVEQALAGELAQLILDRVAPDELVIFDETAEEYFQDPQAVLDPKRREEAVGFGLDLALLTPYVLAVASSVVGWLVTTVADAAREESKPVVASFIRRLFRRGEGTAPEPVQPLTIEQARRMRDIAYQRAKALGLVDGQAALIADSVVGAVLIAEWARHDPRRSPGSGAGRAKHRTA